MRPRRKECKKTQAKPIESGSSAKSGGAGKSSRVSSAKPKVSHRRGFPVFAFPLANYRLFQYRLARLHDLRTFQRSDGRTGGRLQHRDDESRLLLHRFQSETFLRGRNRKNHRTSAFDVESQFKHFCIIRHSSSPYSVSPWQAVPSQREKFS